MSWALGRKLLHFSALFALAFGCAAVRADLGHAEEPETTPRWHVPGTPLPGLPWGGCRLTSAWPSEFFPITLPEAHHARGRFPSWRVPRSLNVPAERCDDADEQLHFLTLFLVPDGSVHVKGWCFGLGAEEDDRRHDQQWALADALRYFVKVSGDSNWTAVRAHFDREARWRDARACLHAAMGYGVGIEALEVAVRLNARHMNRFMHLKMRRRTIDEMLPWRDWPYAEERARIAGPNGEAMPPDPPAITVTRVGEAANAQTVLRYAGDVFRFPPGDHFGDAASLMAANDVWRAFELHAATQPLDPFVTLVLDDALDVPWAYIVGIVDVLADLGVKRVNLPSVPAKRQPTPVNSNRSTRRPYPAPIGPLGFTGMVFEVVPLPEPLPTPNCGPLPRDAPSWWWLVLAGVLAAGIALYAAPRFTRLAPRER